MFVTSIFFIETWTFNQQSSLAKWHATCDTETDDNILTDKTKEKYLVCAYIIPNIHTKMDINKL